MIKRGLGKTCSYVCAGKKRHYTKPINEDEYTTISIEERFWSKVDRSGGAEACWPWLGSTAKGYGVFHPDRKRGVPTARVAYELVNGPMAKGLQACRHCDNPLCCNPKHITPGTHKERAQEREAKGRGNKEMLVGVPNNVGEENPNVKYSEEIVREIRELHRAGASYREIGECMGIGADYVKLIVKRRRWKHVE